jgi:hypothetical protein
MLYPELAIRSQQQYKVEGAASSNHCLAGFNSNLKFQTLKNHPDPPCDPARARRVECWVNDSQSHSDGTDAAVHLQFEHAAGWPGNCLHASKSASAASCVLSRSSAEAAGQQQERLITRHPLPSYPAVSLRLCPSTSAATIWNLTTPVLTSIFDSKNRFLA